MAGPQALQPQRLSRAVVVTPGSLQAHLAAGNVVRPSLGHSGPGKLCLGLWSEGGVQENPGCLSRPPKSGSGTRLGPEETVGNSSDTEK